jgi:hypothetical protein
LGYGCEKHENYKKIVSMLKHGGLTFKVWFEKKLKDVKKNDTKKK